MPRHQVPYRRSGRAREHSSESDRDNMTRQGTQRIEGVWTGERTRASLSRGTIITMPLTERSLREN